MSLEQLVILFILECLTLEMGSGVFFDPREMKRVKTYLPVYTEAKGTLGSKKTPNSFSVSFLTTHFQG